MYIVLQSFALACLSSAVALPPQGGLAGVIPIARSHPLAKRADVFDSRLVESHFNRIRMKAELHARTPNNYVPKKVAALEPFDINRRGVQEGKVKRQGGFNGTLDLTYYPSYIYYGPVLVGTPPQSLGMQFDTGSSDLVVPTNKCKNCTTPTFSVKDSSTFFDSKIPFAITYADLSGASGTLARDRVSIATLFLSDLIFGAVDKASVGFAYPNVGVFGLAFPAIAAGGTVPFFVRLCEGGYLASNLFSLYLSSTSTGSEFCLGCIDSSKFTGDVSYYPLDPAGTNGTQKWWNIESGGMAYNGATVTDGFSILLDSGAPIMILPAAIAEKFATAVGLQATANAAADGTITYTLPCKSFAALAPVAIKLGNDIYEIPPEDLSLGPISDGSDICLASIAGTTVLPTASFGDAFLRLHYTVFDYGNQRVGFAKLA